MVRTCETCGVEFAAKRSDARYHSDACRQQAYRDRHRPLLAQWFNLSDEIGSLLTPAESRELSRLVARIRTKVTT